MVGGRFGGLAGSIRRDGGENIVTQLHIQGERAAHGEHMPGLERPSQDVDARGSRRGAGGGHDAPLAHQAALEGFSIGVDVRRLRTCDSAQPCGVAHGTVRTRL
jgi:hypothetical protein